MKKCSFSCSQPLGQVSRATLPLELPAAFSNSSTSSVRGATILASPEKEMRPTRVLLSSCVGAYSLPRYLARSLRLLKPVSEREPLLSTMMRISSVAMHFKGPFGQDCALHF